MKKVKRAFTLIELLIVVAIIAILAAIAVPNFLEAQTRSKIARVKADMRTIATAIETYATDYNRAPIGPNQTNFDSSYALEWSYSQLTSPVAYITSIPTDPFGVSVNDSTGKRKAALFYYSYNKSLPPSSKPTTTHVLANHAGFLWSMRSPGPKHTITQPMEWGMFAWHADPTLGKVPTNVYDSTNGTVSLGYIIRSNKGIYKGVN